MISHVVRGLVLAGVLVSATAPVVFAADAPKTQAECEKNKDMMWDGKGCVPKK